MKKIKFLKTLLVLIGVLIGSVSHMRAEAWLKGGVWMQLSYNSTTWSADHYVNDKAQAKGSLGTLTTDVVVTQCYWKNTTDWGVHHTVNGLQWTLDNGSNWSNHTENHTGENGTYQVGSNSYSWTLIEVESNSGIFTMKYDFWADYYYDASNCNDHSWAPGGSGNDFSLTYTILPPDPTAISVTASSGSIGGDGSAGSPFLVQHNGSLTLSTSGTPAHNNDGNSSLYVKYGSDSYSGTTTKTISSITSTDAQYIDIEIKYYNSGASLSSATPRTKRVYYKVATYAITLDDNGSYLSDGSATAAYKRTTLTNITAPRRTGYHVDGYYGEAGTTTHISDASGNLQASKTVSTTPYTDKDSQWLKQSATTLYTKWAANTYDVTLKANTGTGDDQVVQATYDAEMPTTLKGSSDAVTVHTKTGYNLLGYWDATSDGNQYYSYNVGTSTLSSYRTWNKTSNTDLYAHWEAKSFTVTLDVDEANQGTITGATTSQDVTYDGATTTVLNRPTAANGYALDGYYTYPLGEGVKVINADGTWIAEVDDYTDGSKNWVHDGDVTLYAYYKKAEITGITFSPAAVVAPSTSITATPTISPTPTGTTIICWRVLYSNDNPLESQPTFSPGSGNTYVPEGSNAVTFNASATSGMYKIEAVLRTGSSCGDGTELCTYKANFQVAGDHNVTVQYKDASGNVIAASTTVTGKPLSWSEDDIEAPDIFGYTFDHWDAGDGVTIKNGDSDPVTTSTDATIKIKAVYDGRLTAVYNQKQMIYFKNTLGWSDVYVNFYTGSYWDSSRGSGNYNVTNRNKHMTRIGTTDVWYFDYGYNEGGSSITPSLYVSFTEEAQNGTGDGAGDFWKADPGVNVVYPANYSDDINTDMSQENGFKAATPMFVPRPLGEGEAPVKKNEASSGWANYYNDGYWTQYTPGTGYTLEIYNSSGDYLKSASFVSNDDLMPMKAVVDLEAGQTYKFQLRRGGTSSAGIYYGNKGTMDYKEHGQSQPWEMINSMSPSFTMAQITTNAAGDYTFNLSYSGDNSDPVEYRLRIAAEYPVAAGDYRIYYTDAAKWSQTSAHTSGWCHPSSVVAKNTSTTEGKTDVVSLYVAYGSSPSAKFQKSEIDGETSAVSWSDVASGTVSLSEITSAGVYNFYLSQSANGTSIRVDSIRPYKGNYYIRTDCAGGGKWDNFRGDINHMMTYSDYASAQSKLVTDTGYTHYYAHWVETGTNVKFCIANEYSQCISDTLTEDLGYVVASITAAGNTNAGRLNSANANIRFMWNERTNRIKRSYLGGSANIADRFLVLEGDAKLFFEDGTAIVDPNRDHNKEGNVYLDQDNQLILHDDGNFIYERTIQVKTGAAAKLTAKYNEKVQYFIGTSSSTVTLLGGDASDTKYTMRVLYDFKTNRLVTAYIPRGNIDQNLKINADIMFLREHQGDIEGITFSTGKSISEIKNVYFALQFNKYTLNNKDKSTYEPLDPLLSRYERDLFYVSFPYDVKVSDIIGFGTYGQHWIIEYYDGAARAREGYWADSESFWKFVTPAMKSTYVLKAGTGYIVALDLDELGESSDIWTNTDQVELLFPGNVTSISSTSVTYAMPEHECTINRPTPKGNRTIADSHWNVMGVPTYHNVTASFANQTDANSYVWASSNAPRYLYTWNMADNSLSSTSSTGYNYHSMHAYVVQYYGDVTFTTSTSPAPTPIAARMTDTPDREYKLELISEEQVEDQTFVRMTDNEGVTSGFEFGDDLSKEMNRNRGNIWTVTSDGTPVAGNSQPHPLTTTIVPVGVKIAANGEYTFSMPEGTNGGDVWLIDNANSSRTNLGLMDYTVNLTTGTYEGRFSLEIPVQNVVTDLNNDGMMRSDELNDENDVRKVFVGGRLYILRDGKAYDATGAQVR